jgi:hypothetical protein
VGRLLLWQIRGKGWRLNTNPMKPIRVISELEFSEPYQALLQALKLRSWPTSVTIATSRGQSLNPSRQLPV